ncbi:MAG TPA: tetratricopeptide repeat protein [Chitinophagaceae bacterium]|nr:tetratricopeptide repeat protein [Chitinophagaceae bacterium]
MSKMDKYTAPRAVTTGVSPAEEIDASGIEKLRTVESWYETNKKMINNVLIGILAVVVGIVGYTRFFKGPRVEKSNDAIFRAQTYFGMDSLNWALNGDGNNVGFLKIIDKYSGTPAANLAHYYAGVCFLKKGDFKNAEKHLREFDGKGTMVTNVAKGALGDALMEQGKTDDAIKSYLDAASDVDNTLLTPLYLERAGMAYELNNKLDDAKKMYRRIKDEFPMSTQARNMDKYLARLGDYNP